jgi:hypothetical protein
MSYVVGVQIGIQRYRQGYGDADAYVRVLKVRLSVADADDHGSDLGRLVEVRNRHDLVELSGQAVEEEAGHFECRTSIDFVLMCR